MAGAFLTLAIVMGEFTIASLATFDTFPIYLQYINQNKAYPAAAVTLIALRDHLGGDARAPRRRPRPPDRSRRSEVVAYAELQNLRREFGEVVALDGIDVALEEGEFLSLLGPSGCGKTTALRLVAGFDKPSSGRIVVDGRDMTRVPPNKRDMGMVFQAYSLFPNMTAERNVEFGLKIRGAASAKRREKVAGAARARRPRARGQALPAPALRRDAAAGRARARARDRAAHAPARRAALGARRQGARAAARGDQADPEPARDHDHLRHPRPGGGALDLRPRRRSLAGTDRADRPARRDLRRTGDAVRGRVRRHDEPARGNRRGGRRRRLRRQAALDRGRARPRQGRSRARARPARDRRAAARERRRHGRPHRRDRLAHLPRRLDAAEDPRRRAAS